MPDLTNTEWLRQRLLHQVDRTAIGDKAESLVELLQSEWSPEFESLMRKRLLVGRFRYGRMDRTHSTNYDRIGSALKRLHSYRETGNQEYLVDAANICLLEFEHGDHPNTHFDAADDGEHVEKESAK